MAAKNPGTCRVLLIGTREGPKHESREILEEAGYKVIDGAARRRSGVDPTVVLMLLDHEGFKPEDITGLDNDPEYPVPVVVVGPARGKQWRRDALQAGAFACLSGKAPREDQIGIVAAANRYRALQLEIKIIRREAEIVMHGLLETYGAEAVRLKSVMNEAEKVRESLEDVQNRIIRSLI